jgi:hypothetical protein
MFVIVFALSLHILLHYCCCHSAAAAATTTTTASTASNFAAAYVTPAALAGRADSDGSEGACPLARRPLAVRRRRPQSWLVREQYKIVRQGGWGSGPRVKGGSV